MIAKCCRVTSLHHFHTSASFISVVKLRVVSTNIG